MDAAPYLPAQLLQLFGMRQQAFTCGRQAQALGLAAKQADTPNGSSSWRSRAETLDGTQCRLFAAPLSEPARLMARKCRNK